MDFDLLDYIFIFVIGLLLGGGSVETFYKSSQCHSKNGKLVQGYCIKNEQIININ